MSTGRFLGFICKKWSVEPFILGENNIKKSLEGNIAVQQKVLGGLLVQKTLRNFLMWFELFSCLLVSSYQAK